MAARPESAKEILSIYGVNRADAEEEIIDPDVPADQAGDVDDFGVIHDSQSEIEISSEAEEPAAAKTSGRSKKAYFDPAVGCYIRLQADGQEVRGELSEGLRDSAWFAFHLKCHSNRRCRIYGLLRLRKANKARS